MSERTLTQADIEILRDLVAVDHTGAADVQYIEDFSNGEVVATGLLAAKMMLRWWAVNSEDSAEFIDTWPVAELAQHYRRIWQDIHVGRHTPDGTAMEGEQ